jgi:protein-disulfide isomerase
MRKILFVLGFILVAFVVFVFVAFQARTYKRDYIFQMRLLKSVNNMERTQQKMFEMLSGNLAPEEGAPQMPPQEDPNKIYNIDLNEAIFKGDPESKVTIVEFSDIQCPFSQRFHSVFMEALGSYSEGVKFVFKNFPLSFHPEAKPAAKAVLAAHEQGKYWDMLSLVMQAGTQLGAEKYVELAEQLGLDVDKFKKDLKDKDQDYEQIIQKDIKAGMGAQVQGTPTFYINGKKTRARALDEIKKEIDKILEK